MPAMLRLSKKATKVAYKVMGVPAPMANKPTKREKEIEERVRQWDTRLSK